MSSRRTMTRYSFGNGRSSFGDDVNGSTRSGGRSYLSNVRPENRSTLCSVMAQLAEETQPSFVTTLKSKAVSENCNVKFSCVVTGYPVPQVTWYKDDTQLDRLCGLPKYEVFHNGQNHSLQIYNCTVEDAAIYQASAINSKGIVSCSGVLEVGEMNEFKIHQKYFAKLKQKSVSRQREKEGKENQEPIRTLSPDRTQRKRRSTMEAFISTPSSTEDENSEENHVSVDVKAEDRLQEPAVEEPEIKPAASTNKTVSAVTTVHFNGDTSSMSGTYIYDPANKLFTPHQSKTPSVKKKIKISSSAKGGEEETGATVSSERWPTDVKNSAAVTVCKQTAPTNGASEEVMEVENKASSSVLESDLKNKNEEQHEKEEVLLESSLKDDKLCIELSSQKKDVIAAAHQLTFPSHNVSDSKGEKPVIENRCKDNEEHSKMKNQMTLTKKTSTVKSTLLSKKENRTEQIKMKETDGTTEAPSGQFFEHISSESMDTSCNNENLPEHPCEPAITHPSKKETSSNQEMETVSLPAVPSEVIQTYTKRDRNDATLKPELPPDKCTVGSPLQQRTGEIQTSTLSSDPHGTTDKLARDTCSTSIESSQRLLAVMTHKKKLPQASKSCVSPVSKQSHVERPVKTLKGTDIQDQVKEGVTEVDKLLMQTNDLASVEKMETETAGPLMAEEGKEEKIGNGEHKDSTKTEIKKENSCSNLQNSKSNVHENMQETPPQGLTKTLGNTDLLKESVDFKKIQKPVTKVISIAELLRSQIKALDLTSTLSVSSIPVHSNLAPDPVATATAVCKELKDDKGKLKTLKPDIETKPSPEVPATKTIKETLLEIYQQLIETEQKHILFSNEASTIQPLHEPGHTPFIAGGDSNDEQVNRNSREQNEEAMDISKERDASTVASPTKDTSPDNPPLLDSNKGFQNILQTVSNLTETIIQEESGSPLIQTPVESSIPEANATILKHSAGEPIQVQRKEIHKLIPEIKVNSKKEDEVAKISMISLTDTCKREDHGTNTVSVQEVQMSPTAGDFCNVTQGKDIIPIQQEEQSPLLKRSENICVVPSATPQELASGARRKVSAPKSKPEDTTGPTDGKLQKKEAVSTNSVAQSSSPSLSRRSPLLQPTVEQTSTTERRSPLLTSRKTASPRKPVIDESNTNEELVDKHSPFKAPQVIRKIRSEMFADASGHLKLWCQFFNILSDSAVKWFKNEEEITQVIRKAGDESQVNLAIVQASCKDAGVYGCSITNEYGTASTDFLLSADVLTGMFLREDLGVGEEIEMTPLVFNKGLADSGKWGNKFFGRIMMTESHIGDGCSHKAWRAKVIYGLEPVFESGNTCIIKIRSPVTYEGREESCLINMNMDLMKQECKIQNLAREYCKIFSTEARTIESFGPCLEVIPIYLMFRPANVVPYATVEMDLTGVYHKYSSLDHKDRLDMRTGSVVEQKCCAFQHWMFQWTNGNLLLTRLEGVDTKITNVRISVKSTGYHGLSVEGNPQIFEQFVSQHKCNYFCGLLGLRSLKILESLATPTKSKGSRSPLLQRKMTASPSSPQNSRKAAGSPRLSRKVEQDGCKTPAQQKVAEPPKRDLFDIK